MDTARDNPVKKNVRHRIGKNDTITSTITKLTGQRDAKQRWRYKKDEELLNAGILAMHHLTPLNLLLEKNLQEIERLKNTANTTNTTNTTNKMNKMNEMNEMNGMNGK